MCSDAHSITLMFVLFLLFFVCRGLESCFVLLTECFGCFFLLLHPHTKVTYRRMDELVVYDSYILVEIT